MSGTAPSELPRLKGRGRIAPAVAPLPPPPPSIPWGPSLRRLGFAFALVAILAMGWIFKDRIQGAAPVLAQKLERELGGLFEMFGKLVSGFRSSPSTPTASPLPAVAGTGPTGVGVGHAWKTAGPGGAVLSVGDLLVDLRPGSRYWVAPAGLELHEGGALLRLPRARTQVMLRGGFALTGSSGLVEIRIDPDGSGTIDVLGDPMTVRGLEGPEATVLPLQRFYFPSPDSEDYPAAEAETFLKRSAWLAAGKSGNPRMVAQDLARRSLAAAAGTEREGLARQLLQAASDWTSSGPGKAPDTF